MTYGDLTGLVSMETGCIVDVLGESKRPSKPSSTSTSDQLKAEASSQ